MLRKYYLTLNHKVKFKNSVIKTPFCKVHLIYLIPYFRKFKFVRVCSLVGRYLYNVYIVKCLKLCFANRNAHVYIKVVLFTKNNENTVPKGRALMQMYRVIHQTKRENTLFFCKLLPLSDRVIQCQEL